MTAAVTAETAAQTPVLQRVLRPYLPHCRYLRSATVDTGAAALRVVGELAIPASCYIEDTGHFNSVEFNICFNQLGYYAMAKAVDEGLVDPYARWSLDGYFDRQLGNILIADLRSSFRRPMNARAFHGEVVFERIIDRRSIVVNKTRCRFWDDGTGESEGEVTVVITDPPAGEAQR
ncbi:FcoT family thioesterase [Dactylosporangium sp. NPDC005555]|uniref:FcoT family thioesterase n=1 Tax=Dactylosporangium sp. NPDC005555 TaxID=3154889 RepID=UPI0033AF9BCD